MKINIEGDEIGKIDGQILGGGVIRVTDECLGMLRLRGGDQALEKLPHCFDTVPADDVGRDFIADQVGENGRMAPTITYAGDNRFLDLPLGRRAVEKSDVLRPGEADEELQTRLFGRIE